MHADKGNFGKDNSPWTRASVVRPLSEKQPYNPLDKMNLGESVAEALLREAVLSLTETKGLVGAGVYALYYTGTFAAYATVRSANQKKKFEMPIYVGKAVPRGARKGGLSFDAGRGKALRDRLRKHATTINETTNLKLADFHFRALMVDDIWIPLGENVLIEKFQPLWNRVIDGFGNNTPGKGRGGSKRSQWDTLHPGRKYVKNLKLSANQLSSTQINKRIKDFFAGRLSEREKLPKEKEA